MSTLQERDLEKGVTEVQGASMADMRQSLTTPPPIMVYQEGPRPVSPVQRSLSPPMVQRPNLASVSSTMTMPKYESLSAFRSYLGIHNTEDLSTTSNRAAANVGIYQRVVFSERAAHQQYQIYSWLINGALGAQIIFAAALTALGASDGPRQAVTAFGAINTITAGFLTFLKGSGLPNRLKYYENEWTKVREYIEQRERDFMHGITPVHEIDLLEEVNTIERMYENVRKDIEANTPDSYMSMNKNSNNSYYNNGNNNNTTTTTTTAGGTTINSDGRPSLARNLSIYTQRAQSQLSHIQDSIHNRQNALHQLQSDITTGIDTRIQNEITSPITTTIQSAKSYFDPTHNPYTVNMRNDLTTTKQKLTNQIQASIHEITDETESQIHRIQETTDTKSKELQTQFQTQIQNQQTHASQQIHDVENKIETKARDLEGRVLNVAEKTVGKVLGFIDQRKDGKK